MKETVLAKIEELKVWKSVKFLENKLQIYPSFWTRQQLDDPRDAKDETAKIEKIKKHVLLFHKIALKSLNPIVGFLAAILFRIGWV